MKQVSLMDWVRCGAFFCLCLAARMPAMALTDIPAGDTVWLQGYDGVVPTYSFAIDGTLRIETIDEPLDVGLGVLGVSVVTNRADGTILFGVGAGGGRFFSGNLDNSGLVEVDAPLQVSGETRIINRGQVNVGSGGSISIVGVAGKPIEFDQADGALTLVNGSSYVGIDQGVFNFLGGSVQGRLIIGESKMVVSETATNGLDLLMEGPGCVYDGRFGANRRIVVTNYPGFLATTLLLTNLPSLDGEMTVSPGDNTVTFQLPDTGLRIGAGGRMNFTYTTNQVTLTGPVLNQGEIDVAGLVSFQARPGDSVVNVTNRGTFRISGAGILSVAGGIRQEAGTFAMDGGVVSATGDVAVAGGCFEAAGILGQSVLNSGIFEVNQLSGALISSNFVQTAYGELHCGADYADGVLDSPALGVTGQATLDGRLVVTNVSPVLIPAGAVLVVVQAGSIQGHFSSVELPPLDPALHWADASTTNVIQFIASTLFTPASLSLARGATNDVITISGAQGAAVVLQVSADLASWTQVWAASPVSGTVSIPNARPGGTSVFYRALSRPARP